MKHYYSTYIVSNYYRNINSDDPEIYMHEDSALIAANSAEEAISKAKEWVPIQTPRGDANYGAIYYPTKRIIRWLARTQERMAMVRSKRYRHPREWKTQSSVWIHLLQTKSI